jgi:Uma2 family endonuclease
VYFCQCSQPLPNMEQEPPKANQVSEPVPAYATKKPKPIYYPQTDGLPMAENTIQYHWLTLIKDNLEVLFRDRPDVFVAGDLFWYPVEGQPKTVLAPDVLVALGRPKGDRPSYLQWLEGNTPPQVIFEVLSPGNRWPELLRKFKFYERYGVEEYYVLDPEPGTLTVHLRQGDELVEQTFSTSFWQSPLLGITFDFGADGDMSILFPDGTPFLTAIQRAEALEKERKEKEEERKAKEEERKARIEEQKAKEEALAEVAKLRAELERLKRG